MRILIAEDDAISRRLLQTMLIKWGYEVVAASSGTEAWEILQSPDAPKFAILDWMMPGMDGVQVCRSVREREGESYTYIILLTAKSSKDDIIEGMASGADDYVAKPFDASELEVRVSAGRRILELQSELLSARETLRNEATRDPLTGLPNRLLFADRLSHSLSQARRRDEMVGVMFLDLDRFKLVNDTMGHSAGDLLLKQVAERLTNCLREVDTIARMGGDEFTVIASGLSSVEDAEKVAKRTLEAFSSGFKLGVREFFITVSIGISLYPNDGLDAETLVKHADTAMYRAKEQGRDSYCIYTEALNAAAVERMTLENSLRKALGRDEFTLYYQPRFNVKTGRIHGVEALLRWRHPELGMIYPAQFIPLAEETGLILPISEWVLNNACAQNKAWQDAGFPPVDVTVNISERQFRQDELYQVVMKALKETGLAPEYLGLEFTEGTLMQNLDTAVNVLSELKNLGIRLSIDDFGTGYSSLSHLKSFPIHSVKIDQSFIKDVTTNPDDAAISGAIVAMAHSLKLRVVAEGVETLEQLEFLQNLNCDEMQGYFLCRPIPADEIEHVFRDNFSRTLKFSGNIGRIARAA